MASLDSFHVGLQNRIVPRLDRYQKPQVRHFEERLTAGRQAGTIQKNLLGPFAKR
jgi:hypothetical protein